MRHDEKSPNEQGNGWTQYQKLVLAELERLGDEYKEIKNTLSEIQLEIAMLKVKSGLWGALAGVVTVLTGIAIRYLSSNKS